MKLPETEEELVQCLLDWRGIETPCDKCGGSGEWTYSSTATWRDGIGGRAMTNAVCSECWGSGDKNRPWTNLRKLESDQHEADHTQFLRWRGLRRGETPCPKCQGAGCRFYSSGATWRGGMGTASMERDICDACWASGDANKPWTDIRALEASRKNWEAEQCLTYLGQRLGVGLGKMKTRVAQLAELCQKKANKRKLPPEEERNEFFWHQEWTALASILAKLAS